MSAILAVCGDGFCAMVSDGRFVEEPITGDTPHVIKNDLPKVRKINRNVVVGFAGDTLAAEKNTRARMALLQVAQNEGLVPTDEEITKNLQERADRTKKTLEEVKANANIPAMQRSEAIRRAADWVIEHSTIGEK